MMKISSFLPLLFLGISLARADVLTLNANNFDTATAGKNVFIKFFAPWYVRSREHAACYRCLQLVLLAYIISAADDRRPKNTTV
jgi:hypothetical protein